MDKIRELKTNPTVGEMIEILKQYDPNKMLHIAYNDCDGDIINCIDETEAAVFLVAVTDDF